MNFKTILSLYNENSDFSKHSPNYNMQLSRCLLLEKKLQKVVDLKTFSLIKKLIDEHTLLSAIEKDQSFVNGFSSAVSLFLESIADK